MKDAPGEEKMTEEENKTPLPEQDAKEQGADLGKFQSVEALMRAYKELEAEFTRRSQRLRALEAAAEAPQPARAEADAHEELYRAGCGDEAVRSRIVGEYLASCRSVPLLGGKGAGVTAPVKRAQTFREAGDMALGYFKLQK